MDKRDEKTMMRLILDVAKCHPDIRAVIMSGSRASPGALKDTLQDYDIVYGRGISKNEIQTWIFQLEQVANYFCHYYCH